MENNSVNNHNIQSYERYLKYFNSIDPFQKQGFGNSYWDADLERDRTDPYPIEEFNGIMKEDPDFRERFQLLDPSTMNLDSRISKWTSSIGKSHHYGKNMTHKDLDKINADDTISIITREWNILNNLNPHDKEYRKLLKEILDQGVIKGDRTGTGTKSIFTSTVKFNMSDGFPLLTTKKMFTKGIITELLWFLNGETNIKPLLEVGNKIWVGDAYKKYHKFALSLEEPNWDIHIEDPVLNKTRPFNRQEFIDKILNDKDFADRWGELGPIYGKQWVECRGHQHGFEEALDMNSPVDEVVTKPINQIQECIDKLKENPDSRRIIVNAWNPSDLPRMTLPPCHFAFQFYTEELTDGEILDISSQYGMDALKPEPREKWIKDNNIPTRKLSLKWHQRSVDTALGLPFNIASYALLLHMVAQQVNMVPHQLVGDLTNVHLYLDHLEGVSEQLERSSKGPSPTLHLNRAKDIFSYKLEDFKIENYQSQPKINFPLSN